MHDRVGFYPSYAKSNPPRNLAVTGRYRRRAKGGHGEAIYRCLVATQTIRLWWGIGDDFIRGLAALYHVLFVSPSKPILDQWAASNVSARVGKRYSGGQGSKSLVRESEAPGAYSHSPHAWQAVP